MKNIRLIALAALMMLGATMQAQIVGDGTKNQAEEFYTCTKWYETKINFVRYFNHFRSG